jgi:hypothetical protein
VIRGTDREFGYEFPFVDVSICAAYTCAEDNHMYECTFETVDVPADHNTILKFFVWLEINIMMLRVARDTLQENVVVADFGYRDLLYLKVSWLPIG